MSTFYSLAKCRCLKRGPRRGRCDYIVITVFLVTLYITVNLKNYGIYTGRNPLKSAPPCKYFNSTQKEKFLKLTYRVHRVLEELGIDHWLMYGSVFGALRVNGPLPWDYDVDIDFNASGKFASMNLGEFLFAFESTGLKVNRHLWIRSQLIEITTDDLPYYRVEVFAFYNYRGWIKRGGLESWVLALHYNTYHTFPAQLLEKPLPRVQFGFFKMPIPRGGIEIQRYLYPDNWWKEVKPVTCT